MENYLSKEETDLIEYLAFLRSKTTRERLNRTCSIDGCGKTAIAKGLDGYRCDVCFEKERVRPCTWPEP